MNVKKFNCTHCGAPKINKYDGIHIICDYCDHFYDIDFQRHLKVWGQDEARIDKWEQFIRNYKAGCKTCLEKQDKKNYRRWQYDRITTYARFYLYAMPPGIPPGEARSLYFRNYADFRTAIAFSTLTSSSEFINYENLKNRVQSFEDFERMVDAYISYLKVEVAFIYNNPSYAGFTQYWPDDIYFRNKIFELVKPWIERIEPALATTFLAKYDLHEEFIELQEESIQEKACENCGYPAKIPLGTIRNKCKKCKHENLYKPMINCYSCGQENKIPSKWTRTIICMNCSTLLKVVSK